MNQRYAMLVLTALVLFACERNGKNEWEDIDYSKIARENYRRENDSAYVPPPSVIGCVDDDLYNCRVRRY